MKVRAVFKTTQEVQIKDFISFNFQCRPLENFDILKLKNLLSKSSFQHTVANKDSPLICQVARFGSQHARCCFLGLKHQS